MAVTPVGNPYVESSDLVANYPGASEALAERIDIVGVNPFADSAARATAIPSPTEGMMSSLNDTNAVERYDGSTWKPVGGKVLQVVSADFATQTSSTSATYVTTGLTGTITPSLSTSRIIILATTGGTKTGTTGKAIYSLFRGTAAGTRIGAEVTAFASASDIYWPVNISCLDSPATSSAQVYTLCMKVANTNTILAQIDSLTAQIILMEISA